MWIARCRWEVGEQLLWTTSSGLWCVRFEWADVLAASGLKLPSYARANAITCLQMSAGLHGAMRQVRLLSLGAGTLSSASTRTGRASLLESPRRVATSAACAVAAGDASDSCPLGVCGHSSGATGCNRAYQGGPTPGVKRCREVQTRWCWQSQSQMWTSRSGDRVSGKGIFLTIWRKKTDVKLNFPS